MLVLVEFFQVDGETLQALHDQMVLILSQSHQHETQQTLVIYQEEQHILELVHQELVE